MPRQYVLFWSAFMAFFLVLGGVFIWRLNVLISLLRIYLSR